MLDDFGAQVALPFLPGFIPAIQSGQKTCTCRTRKYGEPGARVVSPAGVLRLRHVELVTLGFVRDYLWQAEGCASPADFEAVWVQIHPTRGFRAHDNVWLHCFEVIGGAA